jgi:hypothetical protein
MNVYITIDVEVWSEQWKLDSRSLERAFDTYILGKTSQGEFGLPYQLQVFNDADLPTVCFIEPLFSRVLGADYLKQTVEICAKGANDLQLHAHPEWLKHDPKGFSGIDFSHRYLLHEFNENEQFLIIKEAKSLLEKHTEIEVKVFRAGSFSANTDTLSALARNNIFIDSSYNPSMAVQTKGLALHAKTISIGGFKHANISEIPMTVYKTAGNRLRHAQLTACTFAELKQLLNHAYANNYSDFVILSHSVELLGSKRQNPDFQLIKNLHKLADFLSNNKDKFKVKGLCDLNINENTNPAVINLNPIYSLTRKIEQIKRRKYV